MSKDPKVRPSTTEEMIAIKATKDQLVAIQKRRMTGEFYTPLEIAALAHEYLLRAKPNAYALPFFDCCCGTGNLTYHVPVGTPLYCSTLEQSDLDTLQESGQNPNATLFQFDFLNDSFDKLPAGMLERITAAGELVVMINPPFATGADMQSKKDATQVKTGVATTAVGLHMRNEKLGHAVQNTYAQFMYRLLLFAREFGVRLTVGLFSRATWVSSGGNAAFRDVWFNAATHEASFVFPNNEFQGTGAGKKWPVLFSVWDIDPTSASVTSAVVADCVERHGELVTRGQKVLAAPTCAANLWVFRPKATEPAVPMVTWNRKEEGNIRADKIAHGAIGYLASIANGVLNCATGVSLHSSVAARGHGWSVVPENFHDSMVVMACRKLVKPTWLNAHDEFNVPDQSHPGYAEFARDCVIYALFHGANYSSSLDPVEYKGKTYEIRNQFFWLTPTRVKSARDLPSRTKYDASRAETPFVAGWLKDNPPASEESAAVLDAATSMFFASVPFRKRADAKYQLHRFDAGWYQIRFGLYAEKAIPKQSEEMKAAHQDFKAAYAALRNKLRPFLYESGVLPHEMLPADDVFPGLIFPAHSH